MLKYYHFELLSWLQNLVIPEAMVMIEAITRLLPGVLGNPESIDEESHMQDGFAEYPAFTKPQTWRDISVPEILLSGNHAQIAAWRTQSAKDRAEKNF